MQSSWRLTFLNVRGRDDGCSLLPRFPVPDLLSECATALHGAGLQLAAGADVHPDGLHLPADERSYLPSSVLPAQEPFASGQHCSGEGGAMSAIGDLAALLAVQGLSADVVRLVVDLAQQHAVEVSSARPTVGGLSADVVRPSADSAAERRKEYDRNRQAEIRRLKRLADEAALILTSSLTESKKLPEEEVKKERRTREKKRLGPLPENWQPPDNAYVLATESATTVSTVEPIFRDYLKSSGKQYADYDAAFCNFVRNQNKFNGNRNGKDNGRRTVHDAAKDLLAKVRSFDAEPAGGICDGTGKPPLRLLSSG